MSRNKNSNVLHYKSCDAPFDAGRYMEEMRTFMPLLDESDTWIRSGIHIQEQFKDKISSYRLLGTQRPAFGHACIEVLLVKNQIGSTLEDAEGTCVDFVSQHLLQSRSDAAFAAFVPTKGEGWRLFFIRSGLQESITIPADILTHICTGVIKIYLKKCCELSDAALNGYFSLGYSLFDDSVIRAKAREIDKALREIKFCDIAVGSGQMARTMASLIASLRFDLNKYIGNTADRTEKRFEEHFLFRSLYATDYNAGALEIFKTELRIESAGNKNISENHFPWGNILIEDLFPGILFDAAASNPPHLRQEEFSLIKDLLEGYVSFRRNADLYCYYSEKAFSIVKEGGGVGLVISNRWMRSGYGSGLRGFFSGRNIHEIIDYGNIPPVDGIATPFSVVVGSNESSSGSLKITSVDDMAYDNLSLLVEENSIMHESSELGDESWVFSPDNINGLMNKIKEAGIPLSEYADGRIYRGLLTGLNEAFSIESTAADNLIKEDPASAGLLRPFLSGRHVKRYAAPSVKKYLIFIPRGYTDRMRGEMSPWQWLLLKYPAIAAHLKKFEKKASVRKDRGDYWWELRSCRYYDEFMNTKIICPSIVKHISATMDRDSLFSNDKTTIIPLEDFYLLGLLNSKLMDFYFRRVSVKLLNEHYELKAANLSALPIKKISRTNTFQVKLRNEIENSAEELISLNATQKADLTDDDITRITEAERSVNRAVYRLYKLTPAEISTIENN